MKGQSCEGLPLPVSGLTNLHGRTQVNRSAEAFTDYASHALALGVV